MIAKLAHQPFTSPGACEGDGADSWLHRADEREPGSLDQNEWAALRVATATSGTKALPTARHCSLANSNI